MSGKDEYAPPTGAPPNWGASNQYQSQQGGYIPQAQPTYHNQQQDRGYGGYQQGYGGPPPQQQYGYGAPPPQQGYYQQQQQPMYVQQQKSSNNEGCLMACLAALCVCCTLDMLF
ncbi:uncharacterized protein RJT20DRAFT_27876 [Scheffersomyces xylosifermentans]|uniref:uncharacterized protein n=1 Tax=Scheffersomyces xylosifermentans TaxID=1304137 RepID=UPI00315D4E03